ncbi:hypothetical protein AALI21_02810 [Corynebacteriaceae bacterium 6-324]
MTAAIEDILAKEDWDEPTLTAVIAWTDNEAHTFARFMGLDDYRAFSKWDTHAMEGLHAAVVVILSTFGQLSAEMDAMVKRATDLHGATLLDLRDAGGPHGLV